MPFRLATAAAITCEPLHLSTKCCGSQSERTYHPDSTWCGEMTHTQNHRGLRVFLPSNNNNNKTKFQTFFLNTVVAVVRRHETAASLSLSSYVGSFLHKHAELCRRGTMDRGKEFAHSSAPSCAEIGQSTFADATDVAMSPET